MKRRFQWKGLQILEIEPAHDSVPRADRPVEEGAHDGPLMEALVKGLLQGGSYPPAFRGMAGTRGGPGNILETVRDLEEAGIPFSRYPTRAQTS